MLRPLFLIAALAGCTPTDAIVRSVPVHVPVAVPCVPPEMPARPQYSDSDIALIEAGDPAERYRLLVLGREQRIARLSLLEPVVDVCREGVS